MVNYNDDEEIVSIKAPSGEVFNNEGTTAKFYNKPEASLKSERFTVLLELTGTEGNESDERPGLDIVVVLDVSGSMRGKKLQHLKTASTFLIKKLSPIDRLSVVKFSTHAERLCPLRAMTADAQSETERIILGLKAAGGTNMTEGLEEAVKVLDCRRFYKDEREASIMFLSDGDPNENMDGSSVEFGDISVHTFGLGEDYHPGVLVNLAGRTIGGTFSPAGVDDPKSGNLSIAFAQCLGGLLSVVIKDLKMIVTKKVSTIEKVSVGNYPQTRDDAEGSVTIQFGNLYARETRKVLVFTVLEEVKTPKGTEVLEFTYFYKRVSGANEYDVPPVTVTVTRKVNPSGEEIIEVQNEEARQDTAGKMKEARILADNKALEEARKMLDEAVKGLESSELDHSNPLVIGLIAEVKQFKSLMETQELYEALGRSFGFASELSHALQRASAKGDASQPGLFATPAMNQAVDQAKEFEKNPKEYKVPTSAEDKKDRIAQEKKEEEEKKKKKKPLSYLESIREGLDNIKKIVDGRKKG